MKSNVKLKSFLQELALNYPYAFRRKLLYRSRLHQLHERIDGLVSMSPPNIHKESFVSVVIPFFNKSDTLSETLQSLSMQSHKNLEVILVDDGSEDEHSDIARGYIKQARFKSTYVWQKNQGVAAARNNGIKQASSDYVVCLDPDDLLHATYIEKCVEQIVKSKAIGIVSTDMDIFGVRNEKVSYGRFNPYKLYEVNQFTTASMFRKAAWEKAKGYTTGIGYEDWELWVSIIESGYIAINIPEALFKYRTVEESRFTEQSKNHHKEVRKIRDLHPKYISHVQAQIKKVTSKTD